MEQLLIEIGKMAPSVGILVYFTYYFKTELKFKNDEIKELNIQLRENQKESIQAINRMNDIVEDLRDLIKNKIK